MWKQRIISALWLLLGMGVCGLLMAGIRHKNQALCTGIKVNIEGTHGHVFIDEGDIMQLMKKNGAATGTPAAAIPLQTLEKVLRKEPWISNAELFFDNGQALQVNIREREPLARIFTVGGASFYIDSSGVQLPLSDDYAARVPMFTSFTSAKKILLGPDSLLLNDIRKIALQIQQDSFWMAQVSQVNITPYRTFEIIPVMGNQTILLGNADSLQSKFDRLFAFYKQVWAETGFEKYETVSVAYDGQVVATKRGVVQPAVDSTQAQRLINAMRTGADLVKDTIKTIRNNATALAAVQPAAVAELIAATPALNKSKAPDKTHKVKTAGTAKQAIKKVKKTEVITSKRKTEK